MNQEAPADKCQHPYAQTRRLRLPDPQSTDDIMVCSCGMMKSATGTWWTP